MKNVLKVVVLLVYSLMVSSAGATLVGQWTFNGTLDDSSGYHNDGTLIGSLSPTYVSSAGDNALYIDRNVPEYVEFATSPSLNITGGYTIEAWAKIESANGYPMILGKLYYMYGMEVSAGGAIYFYGGDSGSNYVASLWEADVWHHYVGVSDPSLSSDNLKIYIDGVLVAARTTSNSTPYINHDVNLDAGMQIGGDAGNLTAYYDELRLYNEALTAEQVVADYQAGPTVPEPTTCALLICGLFGLLKKK